uniref:HTH La-type RNA-binding domain-containing protein n=1 Tax=Anopheles coluzzii TaxID=1518534 RepID=A0A8W7PA54_ANOCL
MADTKTTTTTSSEATDLVTPVPATETATQTVTSGSSSSDSVQAKTETTLSARTMIETATMTDATEQKESESAAPIEPIVESKILPEAASSQEQADVSPGSPAEEAKEIELVEDVGGAAKEAVEAEEEPDTLSPLMTDNHTFLQHQELMREEPLPSAGEDGNEPGTQEDAEDGGAFETPDDEMCERIVEQVEFYFSNDNILKDAFLLKHVRRNKEGFVSLKLVSSFKRVRQLTKDWRVVGDAIKRKSVKIEVNDLGTKIRRLDALPEHDETTPSRTVVATGLPYDKYTVEKVSELFSKCGEISLIRVLRPGGPIPADVRQFINKHPELQQNECALVEFTESASARRAQAMTEFVVLELVAPKKKTGKKATNVTKFVESYKVAAGHEIERSRGGEGFDRFRMRRGSGFYPKADMMVGTIYQQQPHHHHHHHHQMLPMMSQPMQAPLQQDPHQHQHQQQSPPMPYMVPHSPQQRKYSAYSLGSDASRKFSNCSEGYSSCGEMSRRTSACSSVPAEGMSRRTSACSEVPSSRRSSNCSDFCSCNVRRISQCSTDLMYRRMSQCSSEHGTPVHSAPRKYSVGSNYDRKYANSPELMQQQQPHLLQRRISMDSTGAYDRKFSSGSITGYHTDGSPNISPRKYSTGGFDPLRKLSSGSDQYYNGRKISTDSGYDRRISIGSECSGPRSRAGSILCSHAGTTVLPTLGNEAVVRNADWTGRQQGLRDAHTPHSAKLCRRLKVTQSDGSKFSATTQNVPVVVLLLRKLLESGQGKEPTGPNERLRAVSAMRTNSQTTRTSVVSADQPTGQKRAQTS